MTKQLNQTRNIFKHFTSNIPKKTVNNIPQNFGERNTDWTTQIINRLQNLIPNTKVQLQRMFLDEPLWKYEGEMIQKLMKNKNDDDCIPRPNCQAPSPPGRDCRIPKEDPCKKLRKCEEYSTPCGKPRPPKVTPCKKKK